MDEDEKMTERCREFEHPQLKPEDVIRPEGPRVNKGGATGEPSRADDLKEALAVVEEVIEKDSMYKTMPGLAIYLPTIYDSLKASINLSDVVAVGSVDFKEDCYALRAQIEETKYQTMLVFHKHPVFQDKPSIKCGSVPASWLDEMKANLMLAYRHLEDARMRLGKAVQAFDGGKSCYPR